MKIARFNGGRTALVMGDGKRLIDVAASLAALGSTDAAAVAVVLPGDGSGSWEAMIGNWPTLRGAFADLQAKGEAGADGIVVHDIEDVQLGAPLPSPDRRIFALGANTVAHIKGASARLPGNPVTTEDIYRPKEAGAAPVGFNVLPDAVVGPGATIAPPAMVKKLDYEAECAAIVGSAGRDQGLSTQIWGYTAWNDLGMRDGHLGLMAVMPSFGYSFNLWKNWDGANSCGPWVVVDEAAPDRLRSEMFVNGERRQDWNTADMIYSFAEVFDHLSRYMALRPGDMAISGTGSGTAMEGPLDGTQWLQPGDVMEVRLEGVGPLINTVGGW